MTKRKDTSRFTLVELLVVLMVITVLVSLITPIRSKVIYQTKLLNCMNDLKQNGLALTSYSSDHRGLWPKRSVDKSVNAQRHMLRVYEGDDDDEDHDDRDLLNGYIETKYLFCSFSRPESYDPFETDIGHIKTSYEMYYGSKLTRSDKRSSMFREGDRPVWEWDGIEYKFNILVADMDRFRFGPNRYTTSHPDKEGQLYYVDGIPPWNEGNNLKQTCYDRKNDPILRGDIDRNFLRDDVSVFHIDNVDVPFGPETGMSYDERLIPVQFNSDDTKIHGFGFLPVVDD